MHGNALRARGFSLTELMVAMTIGLIVLTGLSSVYLTANRSSEEMQKSAEQIENGRYAVDLLALELRHAGFYGQLTVPPGGLAALPNPCEVTNLAVLQQAMEFPLQGYDAPPATPLPCLGANDFVPGTDVLVIRRAQSDPLAAADVPEAGAIYLQANPTQAEIQLGNSDGPIGTALTADGRNATILQKDGLTAAEIRRYEVRIYFIAPCTFPQGGGENCTGAGDDGGNPVPALKRLEIIGNGGATRMRILPLVSGIENLQIDYGIDEWPAAVDQLTGLAGDGSMDCTDTDPGSTANTTFTAGCPSGNPGGIAGWKNTVQAKIHVLARNTSATAGQVDIKSYQLGLGTSVNLPAGAFKRHVYISSVLLYNVSGRREIPN